MPEFCTCGAQLPPDARFCHKCGKPQYELPAPEEEPEEQPVVPEPVTRAAEPPAHIPLEIGFHNRVAVRTGILAAALSGLLISMPMPAFFGMLWIIILLVASGFFAVYLYGRRTGDELTVRSGAHLGWMTGIFGFAIVTVFFTINMILISRRGGLGAFYREQFSDRLDEAGVEQVLQLFQSPAGVGGIVLVTLIFLFLVFTLLPTLGGALGARILSKD